MALAERDLNAALVASPGLVAFLTGHVIPAHLGFPSRDGRLEKPTLALITATDACTFGMAPAPSVGVAIPYGKAGRALFDAPAAYAVLKDAIAARGILRRGRLAVEAGLLPAAALEAVREGAPSVKIEPLDDAFKFARQLKSTDELVGLREALALCDAGQAAVRAAVAPGVTEGEFYAAAIAAMIARADGYVVPLGEIQVGPRTALGMGGPTAVAVGDGELVMCDLAPRHPNGWWGDSCLTVACGDPPARDRAVWQELSDGLKAGADALRPGVTAGKVYAAVARHAGEQPGHAGHAIGRDHYEEPKILPDNPERLVDGAVIVLEPGRYRDGRGLRIEHAFRVTPDGGERLSTFGLEL